MTYTDEQMAIIQRWLESSWRGKARCPAGHDDAWSIADSMSFVPGFVSDEQGARIAHERGSRFVLLTCSRCGYVAFIDARAIGLGL